MMMIMVVVVMVMIIVMMVIMMVVMMMMMIMMMIVSVLTVPLDIVHYATHNCKQHSPHPHYSMLLCRTINSIIHL